MHLWFEILFLYSKTCRKILTAQDYKTQFNYLTHIDKAKIFFQVDDELENINTSPKQKIADYVYGIEDDQIWKLIYILKSFTSCLFANGILSHPEGFL